MISRKESENLIPQIVKSYFRVRQEFSDGRIVELESNARVSEFSIEDQPQVFYTNTDRYFVQREIIGTDLSLHFKMDAQEIPFYIFKDSSQGWEPEDRVAQDEATVMRLFGQSIEQIRSILYG